jgi:hypothetical protein
MIRIRNTVPKPKSIPKRQNLNSEQDLVWFPRGGTCSTGTEGILQKRLLKNTVVAHLKECEEVCPVLWVFLKILVDHLQRALEHGVEDFRDLHERKKMKYSTRIKNSVPDP